MLRDLARRTRALANLARFWRSPPRFIAEATAGARVRQIDFPGGSPYLVSDPELIEQILITRSREFGKDELTRALSQIVGDGLLVSEGEHWRRQRRLVQPAFHRERIAGYAQAMVQHAGRVRDTWREGQVFDLHAAMMRLTLDIVAATLFSSGVDEAAADAIAETLDVVMGRFADPTFSFFPWVARLPLPMNRRYAAARERLDAIIRGLISARRASGALHDDLLDMLLRARDEDGSQMSDQHVRDEALILFVAGHETTALALSWAWMLLSQHPRAWDALQTELREVLGDRAPTPADAPALRYTERVILETMRLYPPAWSLGREALADLELGGVPLPRGAQLWFFQWAAHRDPTYFPDPEAFRPERWVNDLQRRLPRGAYFPFGGGPRLCIGQSFAMLEAVLVLATLAQRWRPHVHGQPQPQFSITLRPRGGMRATLGRA